MQVHWGVSVGGDGFQFVAEEGVKQGLGKCQATGGGGRQRDPWNRTGVCAQTQLSTTWLEVGLMKCKGLNPPMAVIWLQGGRAVAVLAPGVHWVRWPAGASFQRSRHISCACLWDGARTGHHRGLSFAPPRAALCLGCA